MEIQPSIEYPSAVKLVTRGGVQAGLVFLTLFLVVYYTVAWYWYTPLTGVQVEYIDNARLAIQVTQILPGSPGQAAGLRPGDRLLTIDGRAITSANRPFYTHKNAGEKVYYTVERAGQQRTIDVVAGDYGQYPEYWLAMLPLGLFLLLVYSLGLLLYLRSAPQDTRARLVGVGWLLAGLALAVGGLGYANGGWFAMDVYLTTLAAGGYFALAAHLYFPAATFPNRARLLALRAHLGLTLLALAAYACQRIFAGEATPPEALASGALIKYIFYLTWFANVILLLKNCFAVRDEETRRQASIILFGTLLGVLPVLVLSALPGLVLGPRFMFLPGQASALMLVCIPLSYGYVIAQRRLLKLDLLVNRALVLVVLAILILVASITILGTMAVSLHWSAQIALLGCMLCALAALLLTVGLHRRIQVLVDRVLYDASYDFRASTARLAAHLSRITNPDSLDELLRVEFSEQMHIQESKLLLALDGYLELRRPDMLSPIAEDSVCQCLLESGRPARAASVWKAAGSDAPGYWAVFNWARVLAPVIYNGALHGVLLLGDRLNGDYYSEQDMENIHTVSQLAALAVANLAAVEALRGLNQRLTQTDEEHQRDMSRELHDDVLGDLTVLHDQQAASQPELAAHLGRLAEKVRQIIDKERAYLFEQGLALALEALIDTLEPLAKNKTNILRNLLPEEPVALDYKSTTALYRIVQEALSNVLKHANADTAVVTLRMDGDILEIEIWDNGIGMEDANHEPSGHYGLLGMRERAAMIGATLTITSVPGEETTVLVRLKP